MNDWFKDFKHKIDSKLRRVVERSKQTMHGRRIKGLVLEHLTTNKPFTSVLTVKRKVYHW